MADKHNSKPQSIRIKIDGNRTTAEIREMLLQALDQLDERPFALYTNCNFYLTPVAQHGGKYLDTIVIEAPYRCAADEHGA